MVQRTKISLQTH